ncbi:FadR/GntR family transcriptional regulator [Kyrpidia spormannii]|nr:FadR/GntR family transcriptional regulator [Kyrpidia spormannii]CAB3391428.1 Transcription regulator HTH, GntR [Kyrpidia spormannii]
MFQTINADRDNLSKRVVAQLKQLMVEGKLRPGDKLPPERELAQLMNVSRTSIREAFKEMATLGLVHIRHGQGVFVAEPSLQVVSDQLSALVRVNLTRVKELFEIRKVLETQTVRWVADRAPMERIQELATTVEETWRQAEQGRLDPALAARRDEEFHHALAVDSGNGVLAYIMNGLMHLLGESRQASLAIPGRAARSVEQHREIVHRLLERDAEGAARAMHDHLASVEAAILRQFETGG